MKNVAIVENMDPEIWYSLKTNQIFELGHWGIQLNEDGLPFLKLIYVNDDYYLAPDDRYLKKYCIKLGDL